jgi:Recombination endonuclease VII
MGAKKLVWENEAQRVAAARTAEWRSRMTKDELRAYQRKAQLKHHYGLTEAQFYEMVAAQAGLCALCRDPFTAQPRVDHDHATGLIRGLLCDRCNVGLGWFEKMVKLDAAGYLERRKYGE